jgi:hypothetical protein
MATLTDIKILDGEVEVTVKLEEGRWPEVHGGDFDMDSVLDPILGYLTSHGYKKTKTFFNGEFDDGVVTAICYWDVRRNKGLEDSLKEMFLGELDEWNENENGEDSHRELYTN